MKILNFCQIEAVHFHTYPNSDHSTMCSSYQHFESVLWLNQYVIIIQNREKSLRIDPYKIKNEKFDIYFFKFPVVQAIIFNNRFYISCLATISNYGRAWFIFIYIYPLVSFGFIFYTVSNAWKFLFVKYWNDLRMPKFQHFFRKM